MKTTLIVLIIVLFIVWFWLGSMRAREAAIAAAKGFCARRGLQFLDDTVALKKLSFKRDKSSGRIRFCRVYQFEHGIETRETTQITLCGVRVLSVGSEDKVNNVIQFPKEKK